jgi:uncharacterized protein YjdB
MRDIRWPAAALGVALLIQGCGGGDNGPDCDPIAGALVERIEVTPATATVELGDSLQLTARAYSCEGLLSGLPPFEWTSASPSAVSVSAAGKVYALAAGSTVQVTASVQGKQGVARISTAQVPVARVEVTPPTAQLGVGRTSTLTAIAYDSEGRELDGRVPAWSSSNAAVVSVNQQGEVTGVALGGPVTITATVEGQSDASLVTVVDNAVATVTVAPGSASIPGGGTEQLTATLRDDLNNVLTGRAINWTSSDESIASIEGTGSTVTVRGLRAGGPVTITATSEGRSGSSQVTVTVGAAARLAFVQQPPGTIPNGAAMPVVTVEVQDAGGNRTASSAPVTLAIGSGSGGTLGGTTTVNAVSGLATFGDLSVTVTSAGTFTLAASSPGLAGATSTAFNVTVPSVTVTTTSLPNATRNSPYSAQLQATGGTGSYTWSVVAGSGALPAGLTLGAAGLLSGTPTATGTFEFTVRATSGGQSDDQALTLTVNQQGVTVTTTSLPAGTRLAPYSQALTATGGDGTYTWTLQSGNLPAGITLSPAGVLGGTPTVAGTFNFQVRATSNGQSDNQALSLVINQPGVTITTTTLPAGTQGVAYSETLTATGGNGTFTWVVVAGSGALPAGLTLSAAGVLSGTPTQAGTFDFTVRATSDGLSAEQALSLVIGTPSLVVTTTTLPAATEGSPYTATLEATGGTGSYAWTLADGNLPGGINLLNDGVLTGTPTQSGSFPITVRVTSGDQVDEQALTLVVNPPAVVIGTTTLPGGTQGAAYSTTLSATGGTGTFTWAVVAGGLPGGITLGEDGTLSGTPTESGTFNFTVEAASGGLADQQALSLEIAPLPGVRLGFLSVPGTGTAGQALATVTVEVLNEEGSRATASTAPVTLAFDVNAGGATLSGGGPVNAVAGVATFSSVTISAPGTGYTLVASSGSLTPDTTGAIDITAPGTGSSATQLAFLQQPTNVDRNAVITPAVQVEVRDASGARVTTAALPVSMAIANNPGGGTLSGTLTRTSVAGVATFNDLRINRAGNGYTLRATSAGLTQATSASFRVR